MLGQQKIENCPMHPHTNNSHPSQSWLPLSQSSERLTLPYNKVYSSQPFPWDYSNWPRKASRTLLPLHNIRATFAWIYLPILCIVTLGFCCCNILYKLHNSCKYLAWNNGVYVVAKNNTNSCNKKLFLQKGRSCNFRKYIFPLLKRTSNVSTTILFGYGFYAK